MLELVQILLKWFKAIAVVCFLAAVGSSIFALMLPEQYLSTYTFMPINSHMFDRNSLFSEEAGENPVYLFGGKQDIERLLTLSQSGSLENYIINEFNLYQHYKIDETDPLKNHWVSQALQDHFSLTKTASGMLNAEVYDENPQFAADLANAIVDRLDQLNKEIIHKSKKEVKPLYKAKLTEKQQTLQNLKDSLNLSIQTNPKDTVTANLLDKMVENAIEEYTKITTIYQEHSAALKQALSSSSIYAIEKPVAAVKKSKPIRWLIVFGATLVAFIVMVFTTIFIEKYKEFTFDGR